MAIGIFYNIKSIEYLLAVQIKQIVPFWILGMTIGAFISVYGENAVLHFVRHVSKGRFLIVKLIFAAVLGAISPITMFGMIPILMLLTQHRINQGILASFIVTSVLINPNVFIYSFVLGTHIALLRLFLCIFAGVIAGLLVNTVYKNVWIFNLSGFENMSNNREYKRNIPMVLNKIKRAAYKTAPNLFVGFFLASVFQLYFPKEILSYFLKFNRGMSVLFSASLGVPVYYCGGGTIPLIRAWMMEGMSIGSVMAFMITGPATKITNLTAIKVMMPGKKFVHYILYNIVFGVAIGLLVDIIEKFIR